LVVPSLQEALRALIAGYIGARIGTGTTVDTDTGTATDWPPKGLEHYGGKRRRVRGRRGPGRLQPFDRLLSKKYDKNRYERRATRRSMWLHVVARDRSTDVKSYWLIQQHSYQNTSDQGWLTSATLAGLRDGAGRD
jgi:hypothetical protein